MALFIKVEKKLAEKIRRKLIEEKLINPDYSVFSDNAFVFIPVLKKIKGCKLIEIKARKIKRKPRSLLEALEKILTEKESAELITSFDIIGSIAVIAVPQSLKRKEKIIGKALLEMHKNIKTVCKRIGKYEGVYRIRKVKVIAGEKKTETEFIESGVRMKLDVGSVYFTPRLSFERQRIAGLVKPNEKIGAFFAGIGPFPLVIAEKNKKVKIYAVELNPTAYKYLQENIKINRMQGIIIPVKGDVRKIVPKLGEKFNRILMPLPKGGENFLDTAFKSAGENCIIHFYQFAPDSDPFTEALQKVRKAAEKNNRQIKILRKRIVRPYAPRISQIVLDFSVT